MKHTILVVEDDFGIRDAIAINLMNQGFKVVSAENGQEALLLLESNPVHLAIVDIMMPVMDGIAFTMRARQKFNFPIIFLSAKSEEIDKVNGFHIGADDYVTKPFSSIELMMRVQSHLKRYEMTLQLQKELENTHNVPMYQVHGLQVIPSEKKVIVDGDLVHLTPKEYQILELLIANPGRVYAAEQIYENIWNEQAVGTETIMVHIRKIREKIEIDPKNPRYLKVVWGVGYKIEGDTYK